MNQRKYQNTDIDLVEPKYVRKIPKIFTGNQYGKEVYFNGDFFTKFKMGHLGQTVILQNYALSKRESEKYQNTDIDLNENI